MPHQIPTTEEIFEVVKEAVEELMEKELPSLLRKAQRKPWMNTNELMELTGWSRRTIQYLRDKKRILYPTDGIEEYLLSNKISPRN